VLAVSALSALAGCVSLPPGASAVDRVRIVGARQVKEKATLERLATTASPKFLGLFGGVVFDYAVFDRFVLARDLERVERFYRARGFYEAHARTGRVRETRENHVEVTIVVDEGEPVHVREVHVEGLEHVPGAARFLVRAETSPIGVGKRFDEDVFASVEGRVKRAVQNLGYAWAEVERHAEVDLATHGAVLSFHVDPGPPAVFGPVRLDGIGNLDADLVRKTAAIDEGEPFSMTTLESAQSAIMNLGVFGAVNVEPVLTDPPPASGVVPVVVHLQRSQLHSLEIGGGLEVDPLRTDVHLTFGWEHRNFLGDLRHLRLQIKPGAVLYPTRLPNFQSPVALLPEERTRVELRQPGFIEARTTGVLTGTFDVYPVLLTPKVERDAPVLGYREATGSFGLERRFGRLLASPRYTLQYNVPFTYRGESDSQLERVLVSYVGLRTDLDLRDDALDPHEGFYLANQIQFAGLGGDARDVRLEPEARAYLPIARGVTLAARGLLGFLFPFNWGDTLAKASDPGVALGSAFAHDVQIAYLRGFFSGGPSSNRGYPLRGVGPHALVPFFNPQVAAQQLAAECAPGSATFDAARCAIPIGGLTAWETSLELRFPLGGPVGGATFCDASDVSPKKANIRLSHPHLSCGFGLRYGTPVGPVRLDVGYRIPGMQVIGGFDPRVEGVQPTVFGLPIAVAFGIGEAF
jgi:outer membrane protein insertion porin family/translocation and assembly module TamA